VSNLTVAVLGLTTGYAMTIWIVLTISSARAHSWGMAFGYFNMALVNLTSTVVLVFRLAGRPLGLPPIVTVLILLPLIGIPPLISFHSWRQSRAIIQESHHHE
jgi:hypothetical protein